MALPAGAANAATWEIGDVFAGVTPAGGDPAGYRVFDNAGNFKEFVGRSDSTGNATGCRLDPNNDLIGAYFQNNEVLRFSHEDPHPDFQTIPMPAGNTPESVALDAAGNFYVGNADGDRDIYKFDLGGTFLDQFDVATGPRGSDHIDLAADQTTLFYTSEGRTIFRYDTVTRTQLADFATLPGGGASFGLRILPPGDGSGGILVADSDDILRIDGAGNFVQAYDAPGESTWFALNLDPNGTSFWSADLGSGNIYRFDIATGAIEVGPIPNNAQVGGLCVLGELAAATPPPPPPGAPPPAAGPNLTFDITGRKNQKVAGPQVKPAGKAKNANRKLLSVKVTCQVKACTVDLGGKAKAPGETVNLKGPEISLQAGETERVRLSAKKPLIAELKGALKAGEKGKAKITGSATAPDGEKADDKFNVKLRGK